jgi:hypothetical protein
MPTLTTAERAKLDAFHGRMRAKRQSHQPPPSRVMPPSAPRESIMERIERQEREWATTKHALATVFIRLPLLVIAIGLFAAVVRVALWGFALL